MQGHRSVGAQHIGKVVGARLGGVGCKGHHMHRGMARGGASLGAGPQGGAQVQVQGYGAWLGTRILLAQLPKLS